MAWENLTVPKPNLALPRALLSAAIVALVVLGARTVNFNEPYLPFAIGGALAFYLRAVPSRREIYVWLLLSAALIKLVHLPTVPFWVLRVSAGLAMPGLAGILLLSLRAVWSEREARQNALALLVTPGILVLFMIAATNVLRLGGSLAPQTDDLWLYVFDGSLGFQPSWAVGSMMVDSRILTFSAVLTYLSLPFAVAVVCAWQIPTGATRLSWRLMAVLLLAGAAGSALYNVVPASGPIYAFARYFPSVTVPYRDLARVALQKIAIPAGIPRNAMPSLHVGWVVLLWWNSRGLPKAFRAVLLLYLLLTVTFTLGGGQHYLVDLVVALPFVLTVQAAAAPALPERSRRIKVAAICFALTWAWLFLVRFGVRWMLHSPVVPWTLLLGTVAATIWLEWWLRQTSPADAPVRAVRSPALDSAPCS